MSTWQLERELDQADKDLVVEYLLARTWDVDTGPLRAAERRYLRVAKELARRDYRDRSHGRRCACSECLYLLEVWVHLRRRQAE